MEIPVEPEPTDISISLLVEWLDKFESKERVESNLEYLDRHILHLEKIVETYRVKSRDSSLQARNRSRFRDLEQNAIGLLNGIKFGISFILHKDERLDE